MYAIRSYYGLLAERGAIDIVEEAALSPATLAAAIDRAVRRPRAAQP